MYYSLRINATHLGNFQLKTIMAILTDWEESPPHARSGLLHENLESNTIEIIPNLMH